MRGECVGRIEVVDKFWMWGWNVGLTNVCNVFGVFFFVAGFIFQAEDGILDLVRSRGLGDVYKRQRQSYRFL